jgi:hypothetical protein
MIYFYQGRVWLRERKRRRAEKMMVVAGVLVMWIFLRYF